MSNRKQIITRAEFIRRYMNDCGLSYLESCKVYETTVSVIEDAVITGTKIGFGKVGAIVPVMMPPRVISMGFVAEKGHQIKKVKREYNIGSRVKWNFRVYKKFIATHRLRWFS